MGRTAWAVDVRLGHHDIAVRIVCSPIRTGYWSVGLLQNLEVRHSRALPYNENYTVRA